VSKVLVIEDNKDNLRLISAALTLSGYEVASAATGEEGIAHAISERPAFILLDINLPGIDGFETAARLRLFDSIRDIPIIAITSYAMLGDREKVMAAGCNGYFEKPIDPLTIMDKIHSVIKRPASS